MLFKLPKTHPNIYEELQLQIKYNKSQSNQNQNQNQNHLLHSLITYYCDIENEMKKKSLEGFVSFFDTYYYLYHLHSLKQTKISNFVTEIQPTPLFFILYEIIFALMTENDEQQPSYPQQFINCSMKTVGYFSAKNSKDIEFCIQHSNSIYYFGTECHLIAFESSFEIPFDLFCYDTFLYYTDQWKQNIDFVIIDTYLNANDDGQIIGINEGNGTILHILFSLLVLKKEGNMIVPISISHISAIMIEIIYLLTSLFEDVAIIKPCMCRFDNSDIYLVCMNYSNHWNLNSAFCSKIMKIVYDLQNNNGKQMSILTFDISNLFLQRLKEVLMEIGVGEMENKLAILNKIYLNKNKNCLNQQLQNNIFRSIKWCIQHNIPYNNSL